MHEPTDTPTDPGAEPTDVAVEATGDEVLDGFESDLDDVAAALDALDADDLDRAERLAAGLDETPVDGADDADGPSAEPEPARASAPPGYE